eukprot:CCRYP_021187-RA/>CCRYP_021187-RA protein AED:0.33 eAED:0.33 QI:0/0/0/1/0/0/2/0/393
MPRMERLDQHICFTDHLPPAFIDKFWEVRQMIGAWRQNMKELFSPDWVVCLDESMSPWTNRFTCPGWVFCPRKPYPEGNEYHTICCGVSGILFDLELREGKDRPSELPPQDSGFCVLLALLSLKKKGVYGGALIKKRRYWPSMVAGDAIDKHFDDKEVGSVAAVEGTHDGVRYNIWVMKDAGYVTKIMGTASGLFYPEERMHTRRLEGGETASFRYTEPYYLHFKYGHLIDDHNAKRHTVPAIETSLVTTRWAMRVFQYLWATSEVNYFLGCKAFKWGGEEKMKGLEFRRAVSWALVNNRHRIASPEQVRRSRRTNTPTTMHKLSTCPIYTSRWAGNKFETKSLFKYNQFTCKARGCKKWVRTYCDCAPGEWLCNVHWRDHYVEVVNSEMHGN